MRIIWTLFWSFVLSLMVVYVLASMTGDEFSFTFSIVLTAIFTIATVTLGEGVIKDDSSN
ncbi:YjzD family protein [Tenuibacillus multivorans]|uniref:DUF2929 family protein n=1 Tax=Tenuibacillus multivorans TaxID=237069 RepID=A0A1G9ZXS8_9BACI|nr:YjzD family protein [Tenuibacillus multivorans]GEL76893.1 hypothetical protein TMU01_11280 [Tenuibacillus multivorans]SDN26140.1 Protein of unknown function [Tenuibacillus multivorans]